MVVRGALESPSRLFQNRATPSQLADLDVLMAAPPNSPPSRVPASTSPNGVDHQNTRVPTEGVEPPLARTRRLYRPPGTPVPHRHGRGGEDRTLVFGFGDQHPYHWTTPLLRDDGGIRTRVRSFADCCLNQARLRHQSGRDTIRTCTAPRGTGCLSRTRGSPIPSPSNGATAGSRTLDLTSTKGALSQLSYCGIRFDHADASRTDRNGGGRAVDGEHRRTHPRQIRLGDPPHEPDLYRRRSRRLTGSGSRDRTCAHEDQSLAAIPTTHPGTMVSRCRGLLMLIA